MPARIAARAATRSAAAAPKRARATLGVAFLGRLPLSASLRIASDAGRPPAGEDGAAGDAFAELARRLLSQLEIIAA